MSIEILIFDTRFKRNKYIIRSLPCFCSSCGFLSETPSTMKTALIIRSSTCQMDTKLQLWVQSWSSYFLLYISLILLHLCLGLFNPHLSLLAWLVQLLSSAVYLPVVLALLAPCVPALLSLGFLDYSVKFCYHFFLEIKEPLFDTPASRTPAFGS